MEALKGEPVIKKLSCESGKLTMLRMSRRFSKPRDYNEFTARMKEKFESELFWSSSVEHVREYHNKENTSKSTLIDAFALLYEYAKQGRITCRQLNERCSQLQSQQSDVTDVHPLGTNTRSIATVSEASTQVECPEPIGNQFFQDCIDRRDQVITRLQTNVMRLEDELKSLTESYYERGSEISLLQWEISKLEKRALNRKGTDCAVQTYLTEAADISVQTEITKIVDHCSQTDVTQTEVMAVQTCIIEALDTAVQTEVHSADSAAQTSLPDYAEMSVQTDIALPNPTSENPVSTSVTTTGSSVKTSPQVSVQASVQATADVCPPGTSASYSGSTSSETDTEQNNGVYYHPNHRKRQYGKKSYNRPTNSNWRGCDSSRKPKYQHHGRDHRYTRKSYNTGYRNQYHCYNPGYHSNAYYNHDSSNVYYSPPTQSQYWEDWCWNLTTALGEILPYLLPTW